MIEDFWIISGAGIPLFYQSVKLGAKSDSLETITKSSLFAGLWSAINTFAQQLDGTSINSVILGSHTLTIKKAEKHNLIFMVKSPREVKDKQVNKVLTHLMDAFLTTYSPALSTWNGDIELFHNFSDQVDKIVHDNYPEKFKRGLAAI